MSTREQRLTAPSVRLVTRTFEERLRDAGVTPLDDDWTTRAMHAASLRLTPTPWKWRLAFAERFFRPDEWKVIPLEDYTDGSPAILDRNGHKSYGWPMPLEIRERVGLVKKLFPTARFEVHALLFDDPWVRALVPETGEKVWLAGWYGPTMNRRIFLPK